MFILLYADDTVLLATNVRSFRKLLKGYGTYCKKWNIEINETKSKVMIFGRCRRGTQFYINDVELERVKSFRYLGLTFTNNRRFIQTIKDNVFKGKRAMFAILARAKSQGLSFSCQLHLFRIIVLPIFLYGCEVWGFENIELIEKAQYDFCRILLRLNKNTSKYFLLAETGLLPVKLLVKSRVVKYWAKLMTGKRTKIVKQAVDCLQDFYFNTDHKSKWLKFIHDTLTENGMQNILINPHIYNHEEFTQRLENQFHQNLNQQIENTNRAIFYRSVNENYDLDKILDELNPQLAYYFIKYKTSNHKLPIETGRWNNTLFNERTCLDCNNEIGDEFHYLFVCPKFSEERKQYIKPYYYRHPSMYKSIQLFQSKNTKVIRNLCLMIKNIVVFFQIKKTVVHK